MRHSFLPEDLAFKEFLFSPEGGGLDESQIHLHLNVKATSHSLRSTLRKIADSADKDSSILMYLSGHAVKGENDLSFITYNTDPRHDKLLEAPFSLILLEFWFWPYPLPPFFALS